MTISYDVTRLLRSDDSRTSVPRTHNLLGDSFSASGPHMWNTQPYDLRHAKWVTSTSSGSWKHICLEVSAHCDFVFSVLTAQHNACQYSSVIHQFSILIINIFYISMKQSAVSLANHPSHTSQFTKYCSAFVYDSIAILFDYIYGPFMNSRYRSNVNLGNSVSTWMGDHQERPSALWTCAILVRFSRLMAQKTCLFRVCCIQIYYEGFSGPKNRQIWSKNRQFWPVQVRTKKSLQH